MDELAYCDATGLVKKITNKVVSSVELLEHYIERIEKYNPAINAVVVTNYDQARACAKAADQALARGECWGRLHGLPMTVKESYNIAGLATTWGNPAYKDNIASEDAVACQRLQSEGAVIFGKTNVPIDLADFQSYNEIYGVTSNPYDLSRTPGGSSGGSAAALAAGLSGLEMGSDIGGSIRNPAHYCGIYGHKPTWDILPMRGHTLTKTYAPSDLSAIGPLARSSRDLKLVLEIVGGADRLHSPGWTLALPEDTRASLGDYRVAVWMNDEIAPVDKTQVARVKMIADLAEQAGARVDYHARPEFDAAASHDNYTQLLHAALSARKTDAVFEANLRRAESLEEQDKSTVARVMRAATLYYRQWHKYHEERTKMRWQWHEFFADYDVLLTPMCMTSAFPHDHNPHLSQRMIDVDGAMVNYFEQVFWAGLSGVTYLPSTVIPTGLDAGGLPVGIQIVAAEMGDFTSIEFARKVSENINGFVIPDAYRDE